MTMADLPRPLAAALVAAALALPGGPVLAELRNSTSYQVAAETIDGGGGPASSSSYQNTGTLSPTVTGSSNGSTLEVVHGFVAALTLEKVNRYDAWSMARGLVAGLNDGLFDDPNGDGFPNIHHFAFDSDPLGDAGHEGKKQIATLDVGGLDYLTLTLPVRTGATFGGSPLRSDLVDGLEYEVLGDLGLNGLWSLPVIEVIPALDAGLPSLGDFDGTAGSDWEYRTFRLTDPIGSTDRQFLKAGVTAGP